MSTNPNYLVQIMQYGSPGVGLPVTSVTAPIPETVNFEVSASYSTLLPQSFTKNDWLNKGAQMMGMKLAVQSLTAQLWDGSTTGDLQINLEFFTENDPDIDVRQPVLALMKLVTPSINDYGLMTSPGPQLDFSQLLPIAKDIVTQSVSGAWTAAKAAVGGVLNIAQGAAGVTPTVGQMSDGNSQTTDAQSQTGAQALQQNPTIGTASYWKNQVSNRIQIRLGNYMMFDNVIVTHVGNVFTSNFDAVTGLPHHVVVSVAFRPMFALSAQDLDNIFLSPGGSTTGNNSFGFSIPDSVSGAASTVTNQFSSGSALFGPTGGF